VSYSFHVTLKQGRSDSLTLEADTKSDILTFFNTTSTAVVSGIKKIVFSKELNINFIPVPFVNSAYYKEVLVFAKSETKSKVFRLYFVNKSVTEDILFNQFLKLNIDDEKIIDIYNIQFIA
jgi:hypothetical protein